MKSLIFRLLIAMLYWNAYSAISYHLFGFNGFMLSQISLLLGFIAGVLILEKTREASQ